MTATVVRKPVLRIRRIFHRDASKVPPQCAEQREKATAGACGVRRAAAASTDKLVGKNHQLEMAVLKAKASISSPAFLIVAWTIRNC